MIKATTFFFVVGNFMLCTLSCSGGKGDDNSVDTNGKINLPSNTYKEKVLFAAADNLEVTGYIYQTDSTAPVIVCCHQARMSSAEYAEAAPHLNQLGFTVMAIDQRTGGDVDSMKNETHARAVAQNLPTEYLDAEQDIIAAVNYAAARWHKPVILWGSSYAAGLCLKVAVQSDNVRAVIAFSPGEYYETKLNLHEAIKTLNKPIFATSTEKEAASVEQLLTGIPKDMVTQYYPETKGTHGSKALWSCDPASKYYWEALEGWLKAHK